MNLKRLSAAALALALTASLTQGALAAEEEPGAFTPLKETVSAMPEVNVPAPGGGYATVITVNGKPVETYSFERSVPGWGSTTVEWALQDLPAVPQGYVPMRAVAQADGGSAYWSAEQNRSWFKLWDTFVYANYEDLLVTVGEEQVEGASVILTEGVTYLPVSVIGQVAGYTVTDLSADGVERYDIATPNGTPLMKLANELKEVSGFGFGMRKTPEQMEEIYGESLGFRADMVTEAVFFTSVNTRPDALMVGRAAPGQEKALEEAMEAYRQIQESTFSWYLAQNLPKVENAKFVISGDWFLFLIAENADEAVKAFETAVEAM